MTDAYLLGEPVSKPAVIAALLETRSQDAAAAPFYRAFEAVGVLAADEALVAVRLVLAGRPASDERVRRLRALARIARAAAMDDLAGVAAALRGDGLAVSEFSGLEASDLKAVRDIARRAYFAELGDGADA